MQMRAEWHDVYPKPKLDGGYLGDGYPWCSEQPSQAFLRQGARFRFLGHSPTGANLLVLEAESPLYQAPCGSGEVCSHRLEVDLPETLPPGKLREVSDVLRSCFGAECGTAEAHVLLVADGFYEYLRPPCVKLFFEGTPQVHLPFMPSTAAR